MDALFFRGSNSFSYSLLPSIGRPHGKHTFDLATEKLLIDQFRLRADIDPKHRSSDLGCLVLARHYGLRTRLLDWTSNPYVALYFAILGFDAAKCFPPCVYVVNKPSIKRFSELEMHSPWEYPESVVFFAPPHLDGRIISQRAVLSLHADPYKEFATDSLERFHIVPHAVQIDHIEHRLLTIGLSHSTIYPGLDGICREINDSPHGILERLNIDRKQEALWKPVPHSWACRPWSITRTRLIDERLLSEFLAFKADASVIGTTVEKNGRPLGLLLGYEPDQWIRLLDRQTKSVTEVPLSDGSADDLQVSKEEISKYFPKGDVTFVTKRPIPDPNDNSPRTQFALYGCMYYSAPGSPR